MNAPKNWKGKKRPDLDDITGLFANVELGAYITGHLIIESVLVQLIELKLTKDDKFNPFDLSFPNKVEVAKNRNLIDESMASFLLEMNRIRNRLAHRLGEKITFDMMFNLARCAADGGVDFSDDSIYSNKELSRECYGTKAIIQEIFQNAAQDLSFIMENHGGKFQFA
ncbi:hypothetical protein [Desulfospira joergensenii]|uniref:hypothetical protein n=1 Tax=Desulfospira joergensenii TaxID=53329 RepID=UPI001ABFBC5B|nr:hypothetical protein [Desulfospira joergensenii]